MLSLKWSNWNENKNKANFSMTQCCEVKILVVNIISKDRKENEAIGKK